MKKKDPIFEYLESIAEFIPASFYWNDLNGRFINLNNRTVKAVGAQNKEDVIGKTVHELYQDRFIADELQKDIDNVIRTRKPSLVEDKIIDVTTRKFRYFSATRGPLFNKNNELIGIMGVSIETTAEKEAERLRTENEAHKRESEKQKTENERQKLTIELEAHQKFRKIIDQMVHDLGSPLMVMSILMNNDASMPEKERLMLGECASKIRGITGSILNQYKPKDAERHEEKQTVELLVSTTLEQIILDKQYEYQHLPVKFAGEYDKNSLFSFINSDILAFKRMMSNMVNNAVDALEGKKGNVTIKLESNNDIVKISIIDTGKGVAEEVKQKILQNIAVTADKEHGHGIGFGQIRDTLYQNQGTLNIHSELGIGTTITISFPKIAAPAWIAEEINLCEIDTIIILDDDRSIHGAWDIRFSEILQANPDIVVKHFEMAIDTIDFINGLAETQKDKVLLLTDYELLKQQLNGLDVVAKTQIKRSVLVTSHYNNQEVRSRALRDGIEILPKQLATEVLIIK